MVSLSQLWPPVRQIVRHTWEARLCVPVVSEFGVRVPIPQKASQHGFPLVPAGLNGDILWRVLCLAAKVDGAHKANKLP